MYSITRIPTECQLKDSKTEDKNEDFYCNFNNIQIHIEICLKQGTEYLYERSLISDC